MNFLLRYRQLWLGVVILGTIGFGVGLSQLGISFSFDDFYPKDDEEYAYYSQYEKLFEEEQNYIIYVALKSPAQDIYDRSFLVQADSIFQSFAGLTGVDSLISGTRIPRLQYTGLGVRQRAWFQFDSDSAVIRSRKRIEQDSSLLGSFITKDKQYLCAYIISEREIFDTRERDVLSNAVEQILKDSGMEYIVSGIPYIRTQYVEKIAIELIIFVSLAMVFIIVTLFITYRNIWGIAIPVVAVLLSLIWILGLMGTTGQSVNLISNLLIPIMFVVGMSDVIHLTTRFLTEIKAGKGREQAMEDTLKEIGFAIFLTSLTTAIGFASLLISRVPPIRDFGLFAAVGVLFTYGISVIILPNALLVLNPKRLLRNKSLDSQKIWDRWFGNIYTYTRFHARQIVWISAALIGFSILMTFRIPTDTHLIEDIGRKDPVRIAMEFFEKNAYGMRPFEIALEMKGAHKLTDQKVLAELEKVQDHLKQQAVFSPFISPVTVISEANYLLHHNRKRYRKVPETQEEVDELLNLLKLQFEVDLWRKVVNDVGDYGRMSARIPDLGTQAIDTLYANMNQFWVANCDTSLLEFRPTGHAFLTENNLQYVRSSLMGGLSIALVVIGLMMGLLFRSWKMLLISMVPNLIPLVFTGGIMGLFGISLTASTSIVFVIAFGIAVDDTIHFLTRYHLERQLGNSVDESIRKTLLGTGKAMVLTSLILLGGFVILLASDFGGTFSVGLFTALTVLFALLADFFLLPVLLRWVDKS